MGGKQSKKSKLTEAQIAFAIKQFETGTRVDEVCRKMGVSEPTFYNAQLKKLVPDLNLDKQMLQDVLKKSIKAFAA